VKGRPIHVLVYALFFPQKRRTPPPPWVPKKTPFPQRAGPASGDDTPILTKLVSLLRRWRPHPLLPFCSSMCRTAIPEKTSRSILTGLVVVTRSRLFYSTGIPASRDPPPRTLGRRIRAPLRPSHSPTVCPMSFDLQLQAWEEHTRLRGSVDKFCAQQDLQVFPFRGEGAPPWIGSPDVPLFW